MFHVKEPKMWISQVKKVERQETKSRYFKLEIWSFFIYGDYTFNFMHRLWASKYVGCLLLIFAKFYLRETNSGKSRSVWQLREQVSACSLQSQWSEKPMPWVFMLREGNTLLSTPEQKPISPERRQWLYQGLVLLGFQFILHVLCKTKEVNLLVKKAKRCFFSFKLMISHCQ